MYRDRYIDMECIFCGNIFRAPQANLVLGDTKSCGCLQMACSRRLGTASKIHGYSGTRIYNSWQAMWRRCTDKKSSNYKNYGGRGITIHPEWGLFENFLRDMGSRPLGTTLDRINNNEGYEMNNCRWATLEQQQSNRRPYKQNENR